LQQTLQKNQRSVFHAILGNPLDLEISASPTVRINRKSYGNAPREKAYFARCAFPRTQT